MGSIQISSMSWERSGKPGRFSFFPKGALTHHPKGAVVFPSETVRSARRMRLLREPLDKAAFLPNCQPCPCSRRRGLPLLMGWYIATPSRRLPASTLPRTNPSDMFRSLTQIQGVNESFHPCWRYVAFHDVPVGIRCGRRAAAFHSNPSERMVDNGDLSFRGQNGQPWSRTLCRGCCGLSELFSVAQ